MFALAAILYASVLSFGIKGTAGASGAEIVQVPTGTLQGTIELHNAGQLIRRERRLKIRVRQFGDDRHENDA